MIDEEVTYFVAKNFNETIRKEKNLRKAAKSLNIFLTTADKVESNSSGNCAHHYNVEILNLFYPELQMTNTKPVIENKLNEWLSELKKFKVQAILVYKKRNDRKVFYLSAKLIANDSDTEEAFKSEHQTIMTKIKKLC